ncbi:MAG: 3-isopropylmalate dehydratase small subunit [Candidatus Dormibacteria bacterium]
MDAFTVHEGLCATLSRDDVDTDQIIPKQFLKRTERDGYGESCFLDWRYDAAGQPRPEFELNHPAYAGASVLVTGRNFGCGSSREHAAWALSGYGFRAVLAPSFADIFTVNSLQNGLLPVRLPEATVERLRERTSQHDGYRLIIDLTNQEVRDSGGVVANFDIEPFWRDCLLSGRDPIAMALSQDASIRTFEAARSDLLPVTSGQHRL